MRRFVVTTLALALASCSVDAAPRTLGLADVGLESSSLDRSVDPCVDFYQFACGGWLRTNEIPGDRARWSRFTEIEERTSIAIRALLEDAAKGIGGDASTKKLGDYYASCMDEASIESGGTAALRPLLDTTTRVKDARSWLAAIAALHQLGVPAVWRETAAVADATTMMPLLAPPTLGLDPAYYTAPALRDKLDAYHAHVARMLALAQPRPAPTEIAATDVVAIETELARAMTAPTVTTTDARGLAKLLKVDWKAYWKATSQAPGKALLVRDVGYFAAVDRLRTRFKPSQWASYFTYHAIAAYAFGLPRAFDAQRFELDKVLVGLAQPPERSKRCIVATQEALGDLLGQQYVARHVPASARQAAVAMFDRLARTGSATATGLIGVPAQWRLYDFEIRRDDFAGNRLRAQAAATRRELARIGKPFDRDAWSLATFDVATSFDAAAGTVTVPAGLLQLPLFGAERAAAANDGALGTFVARELARATPPPAERLQCLAAQYTSFEVAKEQFLDGSRLAAEASLDLDAARLAFAANRALRKDARPQLADGFSEEQQFFIALGQAACTKDRAAGLAGRLATERTAPAKARVYETLRNVREFATAFRCPAGTPMNPAKICD